MKQIKSYTSIWNVEKVLYALNDLKLPFPITYSQMVWLVLSLMLVVTFRHVPPLSLIGAELVKYVAIPVGITWFMSKKTFDGKKPYGFVKSVISYVVRSKRTCMGKKVVFRKQKASEYITIVRRITYVPD